MKGEKGLSFHGIYKHCHKPVRVCKAMKANMLALFHYNDMRRPGCQRAAPGGRRAAVARGGQGQAAWAEIGQAINKGYLKTEGYLNHGIYCHYQIGWSMEIGAHPCKIGGHGRVGHSEGRGVVSACRAAGGEVFEFYLHPKHPSLTKSYETFRINPPTPAGSFELHSMHLEAPCP